MKTAMQELIEELNLMYNKDYAGAKEGLRIAIDTAMNQLKSIEKEKQQIMDAYKAAITSPLCEESQNAEAEEYYNETFKKD